MIRSARCHPLGQSASRVQSRTLKLKQSGGWSPNGIKQSRPEELPGGQILAGAIFFSPWTNLKCDTPDYYYNAFAKIVDKKAFKDPDSGVAYVGDLMFRGHPEENLDEFTANAKSPWQCLAGSRFSRVPHVMPSSCCGSCGGIVEE